MPRPKLPGGTKRSARVMTALRPSEYARLEQLHERTGLTISDLLREALLKDPDFQSGDRRKAPRR